MKRYSVLGALAFAFRNSKWVWFLVAAISAVSFSVFIRHGFNPTVADLFGAGGGFGSDAAHGESWRVVTQIFLHADLFHLLFNMIALFFVGIYARYLFSTPVFLFLFLASGVAGSIFSSIAEP